LQDLSETERHKKVRNLCRIDLFFLLVYVLGRHDANKDWLFDRCREVQAEPDGHIDLWSREHYKSTIITFALTIQNILNEPDITIGIFSHTRPTAKAFLRQIKREFEGNDHLKALFPDILWSDPFKDAPKWSEDDGLVIKRKANPKESTLEAHGLVDGMPTGRHFGILVYDDVVTEKSVTSPDMMAKTLDALSLSYNLGTNGGRRRFVGTRYHYNDAYKSVIDRQTAIPRLYPATDDGTVDGTPVLLTRAQLEAKRRDQGPYLFSCQMLQDPMADEAQGFLDPWIKFYDDHHGATEMNRYILCDPAGEKKKTNDYTAAWVVGLSPDKNIYLLDMIRDRLNLTQRADLMFKWHRKWQPYDVGYEKYGLMADIEHMQDRMERENYRFDIQELGGSQPKNDRIRRLIPDFEQGRIYMPRTLHKTDYEGVIRELVNVFIEEEYKAFPVSLHDDMLDALSRMYDLDMVWPETEEDTDGRDRYAGGGKRNRGSWMTV
jgi:predicted phage terminase large subunit-like protein